MGAVLMIADLIAADFLVDYSQSGKVGGDILVLGHNLYNLPFVFYDSI